MIPTPAESSSAAGSPAAASSRTAAKPQRVLACVLCQQRKVKCDRRFPCANCVKACTQCVPATLVPRERRRRFPERELLERLRRYESLLRENNIEFEPLHRPVAQQANPNKDRGASHPSDELYAEASGVRADLPSREKMVVKSETVYEAKDLWQAMKVRIRAPNDDDADDDDDNDTDSGLSESEVRGVVYRGWDDLYEGNEHLLLGPRKTKVELSTLHPEHVQIFRLWQIYLENVNPLLKVTHTPTLQVRIIDAAGDVANISPTLEALMFSIYCVSILSLDEDKCLTLFGSLRDDLLTRYQFGCQQALLNCGVLASSDRDSLTALYLYLVSVRPVIDPPSLSSMFGAAIRIAQRMGIHDESTLAKCTALEAEMRRRLWWSLVIFDSRVCEMSDHKITMLVPTWDCRIPLNVNDSDIRPEMKASPANQEQLTEAVFARVRSELADFVRHSTFHLDFSIPSLKAIAKNTQQGPVSEEGKMAALAKTMEDRYLQSCNPENPIHFMTTWWTRGHLARVHLLDYYSKVSISSAQPTDAQRDAAISHAQSILECDTKITISPLTKGYQWFILFHFPFPAYNYIIQDLKKRPNAAHAERSWGALNDNYEARLSKIQEIHDIFFQVFSKLVPQAWDLHEAAYRELGKSLEPPRIVSDIKQRMAQIASDAQVSNTAQPAGAVDMSIDEFLIPMTIGSNDHSLSYGVVGQESADSRSGVYSEMPGQATMDLDVQQLDWTTDWNPTLSQGW